MPVDKQQFQLPLTIAQSRPRAPSVPDRNFPGPPQRVAGMIPMALGTGERAQTAPLGRAVIGGLLVATVATLTVLPAVYSLMQARVRTLSASLDPDDPSSTHYEPHA